MSTKGLLPGILGILLFVPPLAAQVRSAPPRDYQGANAAIRAMLERPSADAEPAPDDLPGALRRDLKAFAEKAPSMPHAAAAEGWLALVTRFGELGSQRNQPRAAQFQPIPFKDVLAALPPPPAWEALAERIRAAQPEAAKQTPRELAMLLLADLLAADPEAQWKTATAMRAVADRRPADERTQLAHDVFTIMESLAARSNDPSRALRLLHMRLAMAAEGGAEPDYSYDDERYGVPVPDLVTLFGPVKAEALLRRYLTAHPVELGVPLGDATRRLARRLALELVPKLKAPQWALAHALDATRLFEALEKRFPPPKRAAPAMRRGMGWDEGANPSWEMARAYYLLGLIAAGRTWEAAALAERLGDRQLASHALQSLERMGHSKALSDFFHDLLAKRPFLPYWDVYISVATHAGQTARLIADLRAAVARPGLPNDLGPQLRDHLYKALLAADQVDEAVRLLRELLSQPQDYRGLYGATSYGVSLASIGHLLKNDTWLSEGIQAATAASADAAGGYYGLRALASLLVELGRGPEAEKLLIDAMRPSARQGARSMMHEGYGGRGDELLIELAGVYHDAGRHRDVVALLDGAPSWGAVDLAEALFQQDSRQTPLGHMAAAALGATGKRDRALAILEAFLNVENGFDPSYALLVELRGQQALPFLDLLAARDGFEERPLIWKAELLRRAGRLEEAEVAARAAIAIDPSDGEQKYGRRMRVYAILAEIRAARGDRAQADLFRGAVRAIRLSEQADEFYVAGLLQRGIRLYKESLTHFADAYCIQSRLAIQLAEQGRHHEAEAHYRRAYELMPDSFGRMETHCFGCEGVFRGEQAVSIAEQVFKELVVKTPEKPQVHYLLGYLREEQGRYPEALDHYRAAVARDPDYLNAWVHLQSLGDRILVPQADRDAATLNLLRLDPQRRRAGRGSTDAGDLRALWSAAEAVHKLAPPPLPASLYPLPASKDALDKIAALAGEVIRRPPGYDRMGYNPYGRAHPTPPPTPAEAVAQERVVAALAQILDRSGEQG